MTARVFRLRPEPRMDSREFARRVGRDDESARAAELGLRVAHAELVEERSPRAAIGRRGRQAGHG